MRHEDQIYRRSTMASALWLRHGSMASAAIIQILEMLKAHVAIHNITDVSKPLET